ncbi:MAG TPA: AMP-binding protein [Anaerolineaceae bacterium]|nr:AMP-binding protein [Anaerolineaceae bacterium]
MVEPVLSEQPIVWVPDRNHIERANLTRFIRKHGFNDYFEMWQRSVDDPSWFTSAVIEFLDIRFSTPYNAILDTSAGIAWPRWCVGGRMNIVLNCLDKYAGTPVDDQPALGWEGEEGGTRWLTYAQLRIEVNHAAAGLHALGFGPGDIIGLYLPMIPETVIAFLAIVKIGAIILPLFSGFGPTAVAARLQDAEARGLITADGFYRRGKAIAMKPFADLAVHDIPSVKKVVVVNRAFLPVNMDPDRDVTWDQLVTDQPDETSTYDSGADDPLMLIYTSGTTGTPKGTVHTHCGFPIKAAQDMAFGTDVHPGDVVYWITDIGWMMGPWLIFGSLLLGASMFLYDGAADYPDPGRIWGLVERHGISMLGLSPSYVRSIVPHGPEPIEAHDISSLRLIASTGEPWNPEPWHWLFQVVGKEKLPIINYTGGTELSGGILMSTPVLPIKPCAFNAACPGMAADVLNERGQSVRQKVGELVIKAPWIGMTRGFWKDPQRYLDTYWSRWPNIWVHGDWAATDADGQWYVYGRSDDTIKIAGKRLGPAEVESILVSNPAVIEAAAIGVPDAIKGSAMVVFCVLRPNVEPSRDLAVKLKNLVSMDLGKALAPKQVVFISDLPKTRNAKVMRRVIRSAFLQQDPGDISSLLNPEVIPEIRQKGLAAEAQSRTTSVTGQ